MENSSPTLDIWTRYLVSYFKMQNFFYRYFYPIHEINNCRYVTNGESMVWKDKGHQVYILPLET